MICNSNIEAPNFFYHSAIYYETKLGEENHWRMHFSVVQNLEVLKKVFLIVLIFITLYCFI